MKKRNRNMTTKIKLNTDNTTIIYKSDVIVKLGLLGAKQFSDRLQLRDIDATKTTTEIVFQAVKYTMLYEVTGDDHYVLEIGKLDILVN